LHVNELENSQLTDEEVCQRWSRLYSMPTFVSQWRTGAGLSEGESLMVKMVINRWRERLMDISWLIHRHPWYSPSGPAKEAWGQVFNFEF
jgi:hypothetical protein